MSFATPTQTAQAGPVSLVFVPQSTMTSTTSEANQVPLNTGWIVAIITMVVLAALLTYNFWEWRRKRNAGRYGQASYAESQEYVLQRPKPSRVRGSTRFSRFDGVSRW